VVCAFRRYERRTVMKSYSDPPREEALEDVLEVELEEDLEDEDSYSVPLEADPADTAEQHQLVGGDDEEEYR
jgi:hypothetical protein